VIRHILVLGHFGQENDQTTVYLYRLYISFKYILISPTSVMGTPNCMGIKGKAILVQAVEAFRVARY
jgi:hypothetical protein